MRIEHNHNWVEISEEEYNKHTVVFPPNATYKEIFDSIFDHYPKEIVRCQLIIPEHICGILNVCHYMESNDPDKKYKYFKSIGKRLDFIVNSAEYEILKDCKFLNNKPNAPTKRKNTIGK